ncbi:MAG TPA: FAD binding domain-containing protein [Longimicrobium sp.]|jgi:4-hydroxybenzoyl-CoA reductase subunit beta|uniref:FAD binding domain-containing protein n=1 Tax=Longimicrobium sp. TaxID=2029185 RepID=UPI002ED93CBB
MLRLHEYTYHRPGTLAEALAFLREHEDAIPIAGGTDLMPNMKLRLFTPRHLVALKGIAELHGITVADADGQPAEDANGGAEMVLGAAVTLTQAARDERVRRWFPALAQAAGQVGGPQVRNQGTLGGNLCLDTRCTYYNQTEFWRNALGYCLKKDGTVCHVTRTGKKCVAAHSADTATAMIALGARVDLVSAEGTRTLPVEAFFVADGQWNIVRRRDELVARIRVPLPAPGVRMSYQKVRQRNSIDFPLLSIAAVADLDAGDVVRSLSVVVSALGSRPRTVTGLDKLAPGNRLAEVADAVAQQAYKQCHPLENIIVDPEWRRAMVPVYVRRALQEMSSAPALAA